MRSDAAIWPGTNGAQYYCTYEYDTPAVQQRYVSFDGVNEVLAEDYSYGTTWAGWVWSSKTTTVTTTVRAVQSGSLQTIGSFPTNYTYSPIEAGQNQYDAAVLMANIAAQIPLEQSIVYHDFSGSTLKTVAKTWHDQYLMSSQSVMLNDGSTGQTAYTYYSNGQLATETEYDYGGAPLKRTAISYQALPATPVFPNYSFILDRPCQVVTYDGSGTNRVAETDYLYDGGTAVCGTAGTPSVTPVSGVAGHDETNYAPTSTAPRGNVTQKLDQIIQSSTSATSTYTYDETGQVTSWKDPRGNTTSYSYADSYALGAGSPPAPTNTYLTTLTLPRTGGVNHVEQFTYRYSDGQLAASIDQNSQTASYSYADPLGRLTETDYPDGGKTTAVYNDSGTTPSVTTARLLTGSSSMTSTTVMDGAGHPIQTQLTSDPSGTDFADTVYDGLGRARSVSNPYRSDGDSTYGIATYLYDGLGRIASVTTADGALAATSYPGPSTTTTDQARHQRTTVADALGRIKQVVEDPGSSPHLNYATTYTYNALDDLIGVSQSGQIRSFTYDSLRRLTQATNPESGAINYGYDANGNLVSKTDGGRCQSTTGLTMA